MPKNDKVSISVIRRLPRYYRYLGEILKNGVYRISSRELAIMMNLTASQIRQDLNCFGGFGQQGYGYNVKALHTEIGIILGVDKQLKTILVGTGNLGKTIATHLNFETMGIKLVGAFDSSPVNQGQTIRGLAVLSPNDMEIFCKEHNPQIAIMCIPKEAAEPVSKRLIEYGIKGFWNFSQYDLALTHSDVVVENVHLGDSIMTLCYRVNSKLSDIEE